MKNTTLQCAAVQGAEASASQSFPPPPTRVEDKPQGDRAGRSANKSVAKAGSKTRCRSLRGRACSGKGARSSRDRVSTPVGQQPHGKRETVRHFGKPGFATTNSVPRTVAASDDAHTSFAAGIEPTGTGRARRLSPHRRQKEGAACAAVALSWQNIEQEDMARTKPDEASPSGKNNEELKVPTDLAALQDGPSYVRAVAAKVDLVGASAKLVVSTDEKIAKAELDRLRELIFGKGGPQPADETAQMDFTSMYRTAPEQAKTDDAENGEQRGHN